MLESQITHIIPINIPIDPSTPKSRLIGSSSVKTREINHQNSGRKSSINITPTQKFIWIMANPKPKPRLGMPRTRNACCAELAAVWRGRLSASSALRISRISSSQTCGQALPSRGSLAKLARRVEAHPSIRGTGAATPIPPHYIMGCTTGNPPVVAQ